MNINQILDQAEALHRKGKLQEATARYQDALRLNPENADAFYGLGTILMQQKNNIEALKNLQKATSLLPDVPEFLFNQAMVEAILGDTEKAKKTYLQAASCTHDDAYFLLQVSKKLLDLGLNQQALSYLKTIPDKTPEVCWWIARAQIAVEEWSGALKTLNSLTQQFPDNPSIWREHSKAAGGLRDFPLAIKSFHHYLDKKVADDEDLLALADLYLMARMPDDAMVTVQKAFDLGLNSADAFLIAGKCARLKGDNTAVKKYIEKAIESRPTFGLAWQVLFEVLDKTEISDMVEQCMTLEKDDRCTDKDRIALALAAGQAYEKMARFSNAFLAFDLANHGQKDLLAKRGFHYNHAKTEAESQKIISHHPKGAKYAVADTASGQRPIFILGMPRTGTTLVEKILGGLKDVENGGENEALESIVWKYYRDIARKNKPCPTSLTGQQLAEMAAAYWQRTPYDGPVVTDKMPHNFRHVGLITQIFPDAPVIHMTRDPRDVCLSIYCRLFPAGHNYAVDLDWLAHFYAQSVRLKNHWQDTFPNRVLEVIYEDLVENPVEKTQEIAAFCQLDWQPECLDFHKVQGPSFTFSELQVRRPINRDGIGRWHHYEKQLHPLTKALKKYGIL